VKLYAWFKRLFENAKCTPLISCVHGRTPFLRNLIAAKLFTDKLGEAGGGAIICSPKACIGIAESLGVDIPDDAKWWHSEKKWALVQEELAKSYPDVTLSREPIDASLIWVDGECLANGLRPKHTVIFTGTLKEDPFYDMDRTTYEPGGQGTVVSWSSNAFEYCSSWSRKK